jgi:hypothetical protein
MRPDGSLLCRRIHSENRVRASTAYSSTFLGDKRAAAMFNSDRVAARQLLQRAAHGVAVHAKVLRQLGCATG